MQVYPQELDTLRQPAFLVTEKYSVCYNDYIFLYLNILSLVPKLRYWLVLAYCLKSWVVTLTVRLAAALLMRQTFSNRSGVTLDVFSACEALEKASVTSSNNSQSSIYPKSVVILKMVGYSNISQSCGLEFVLPTAAANFDRSKSSFNLSKKNMYPK